MQEKTETEEKLYQKLTKNIVRIIFVVIIFLMIFIGISSFFITAYFEQKPESANELTQYKADIIILNIILIPLMLFLIYKFTKINPRIYKKIVLIAFLIIFITHLIWGLNLKTMPVADQSDVVQIGENWHNKEKMDYYTKPYGYLGRYPFQVGFSKYVDVIYHIFDSTDYMNLEILNVVYSLVVLYTMYLIAKKIFKDDVTSKIAFLLIFGFSLYFLFFNPHIYGNIIGLMFALFAIYETISYLENKKIYKLLLIGLFILISIILKSNYNIFLCGIMFTLIYEVIKNKEVRDIFGAICIILIYLVGKTCFYNYIEKSLDVKLPDGIPMISYLYMGMAEPRALSPGWYTADTMEIYDECGQDTQKASDMAKQLLVDRTKYMLTHPVYMFEYYSEKYASTWLNPTFQTVWCSKPGPKLVMYPEYDDYFETKTIVKSMLGGTAFEIEEIYFNAYQVIIFIFGAYGIIKIYKKDESKHILLPIIFLGGFVFHMIWETKAIYVLQYYLILLPYCAYGLNKFYNKIKGRNLIIEYSNKIKKEILNHGK